MLGIGAPACSGLSEPKQEESRKQTDCYGPPEPMNSSRHRRLGSKLLFDEFIVIKLLFGQIETARMGFLRPPSLFVRATLGAGSGTRRNLGSAIGTNVGRHLFLPHAGIFFVGLQIQAH